MSRIRRARLRIRLTAAAFVLSLLIVSGAVVALVAVLRHETDRTVAARLAERTTALVAAVDDRDGRVDVGGSDEALFDGPNWVYDVSGARIEGSAANGSLQPLLTALSRTRTARTVDGSSWHLRAAPVVQHGAVVAVAVTGVDERPYEETLGSTLRAALLLGLLAVLGATLLTALVLSRSLGPIAVMTEQAAGWSRTRSDGRFALGPPKDEIGRLGSVLDDLLDRVDEALAAERRLTAEIAHELRTPLTLLSGEAQIALMDRRTPEAQRVRFQRMADAADTMARAVTTLLADATAAAERDPHADAAAVVRALVAGLPFRGVVEVRGEAPPLAPGSAALERMLAPLLDNAARLAASRIDVRIAVDGDGAEIRVADDGPGVDPSVRATLFAPGVSTRRGGTGIGLALAARLARDAGGDLLLLQPAPAVFALRLPLLQARSA